MNAFLSGNATRFDDIGSEDALRDSLGMTGIAYWSYFKTELAAIVKRVDSLVGKYGDSAVYFAD